MNNRINMKILTAFELTDTATKKFNNWLDEVADENCNLNVAAVSLEAIDSFQNDLLDGEDELHYELEGRFTWKKQPAVFVLSKNEYVAAYEYDRCDE